MSSLIILVVEDEALVRATVEDALKDGGYEVATAGNAEQAIKMLEAPEAQFRALVTDVVLKPGPLSGWDVAKRGREINPELPVIYMTATDTADWAANGVPNSVLVSKPFAPAQIVTAVSQLLNLGNTPGA